MGDSDIDDVALPAPRPPVAILSATPITATEAAWVRLKGADAMREAWRVDGVDVLDPAAPRRASESRASGCGGTCEYSKKQTVSITISTAG